MNANQILNFRCNERFYLHIWTGLSIRLLGIMHIKICFRRNIIIQLGNTVLVLILDMKQRQQKSEAVEVHYILYFIIE